MSKWFQAMQAETQARLHVGYLPSDDYVGETNSISLTAPIWSHQSAQSRPSFLGAVSARVRLLQIEDAITKAIRGFQGQSEFFKTIEYQVMREDGLVLIDSDIPHKGGAVNLKKAGLPSALKDRTERAGFIPETHARRHVEVVTGYADSRWNRELGIPGWRVLFRVDQAEILASLHKLLWIIGIAVFSVVFPMVGWLLRRIDLGQASLLAAERERSRARKHERWLRSILEAEPEGILVIGENNVVQEANPAACALFEAGFSDEIVGKSAAGFAHADDWLRMKTAFDTAWTGHQSCVKGRVLSLSGQIRWVEITSVPLPADEGLAPSTLCLLRDITEQERADRLQLSSTRSPECSQKRRHLNRLPLSCCERSRHLHWDVGLFWPVQEDRDVLSCDHNGRVLGSPLKIFGGLPAEWIASGSGLPGRCWERGEAIWVADLSQQPRCYGGVPGWEPCSGPARFRSGFEQMCSASWSFSVEKFGDRTKICSVLATVGSQIGLFIERAEVEVGLARERDPYTINHRHGSRCGDQYGSCRADHRMECPGGKYIRLAGAGCDRASIGRHRYFTDTTFRL